MSDEVLEETLQVEETAQVDPVQNEDQKQQQESTNSKNFEELRKQKARLERERDDAYRLLRENEEKRVKSAIQQENEAPDAYEVAENDIVEGKHLKRVNSEIKKLREEVASYQQKSVEMTTEARVKAQYPDFDTIVSKDNIEELRNAYPEIAQTLNSSSDLYNKAASAYTLIKKLGIHRPDLYTADKERVRANTSKPLPSASLSPQSGDSPLSNANAFANGLTPELKKSLHREMTEAMKNK